jgi:hypothetical protein
MQVINLSEHSTLSDLLIFRLSIPDEIPHPLLLPPCHKSYPLISDLWHLGHHWVEIRLGTRERNHAIWGVDGRLGPQNTIVKTKALSDSIEEVKSLGLPLSSEIIVGSVITFFVHLVGSEKLARQEEEAFHSLGGCSNEWLRIYSLGI